MSEQASSSTLTGAAANRRHERIVRWNKACDKMDFDKCASFIWEPEPYLTAFGKASEHRDSDTLRTLRKLVLKGTHAACTPNGLEEFSYVLPNEERVVFCTSRQEMVNQISSTRLHTFEPGMNWQELLEDALGMELDLDAPIANQPADYVPSITSAGHVTEYSVVDGDCIEAGEALIARGFNPVVLNMASDHTPGGGYKGGSGAQEEDLFRRTNLLRVLANSEKWYNPNSPKRPPNKFYPLPDPSTVYSPSAWVMRAPQSKGYAWLERPYKMAFVASAAYRRPSLVEEGTKLSPKMAEGFKDKIRALMWTAARYGHDAVVLSAWGCGAFLNPPSHIAELFRNVLQNEPWLQGRFRNITFAIFDDHNSYREHNTEGNVLPFLRTFLPPDHPDLVAALARPAHPPNPRVKARNQQNGDRQTSKKAKKSAAQQAQASSSQPTFASSQVRVKKTKNA